MITLNTSLHKFIIISSLILLLIPSPVSGDCACTDDEQTSRPNTTEVIKFKLAAIASVLVAGGIGVSLPLLGRKFEVLRPENDIFFMIKAFAAGVILATGFIHILPDAFKTLTSPCLGENPWGKFPFTGFICMLAAIGTLMVDSFATSFYKEMHFSPTKLVNVDEEAGDDGHAGHVHVHTHATHGHSHGTAVVSHDIKTSGLVRQRIISQILELGIVVHSVIIGTSLGASQSPDTIKPLFVALSFHQFFEGMGLGGCISQEWVWALGYRVFTKKIAQKH